jgi:tetratricopeptide (TPR) repeat protein
MKKKVVIIILILFVSFTQAQHRNDQRFALAQSYEQAGDFNSAAKIYEELYLVDPSNSEYINGLYRVYIKLKNYAALVNILEEQIRKNPNDIVSYGMLGSTNYLMGNEEKAKEIWQKPFKSGNVNPVFYRIIAEYVLERRAFEIAIELYEEGKSTSEDKVLYSFDLARLYSLTMQFEKAAGEYCFILSKEPAQLQTVEAKVFENVSRPGALDATINILEDCADKKNLSISYLLAKLYNEKKDFDKAYEIYLELDEAQSGQGRELYKFAQQMFAEKQYRLTSEVFRKITELYPGSPIISLSKLGYARSLEASLFEEYTKLLPMWKTYFPIQKFYSEDIEEVLSAFNEIISLYSRSEPAYESMLRTAIIKFYLQNDYDGANRLLKNVTTEAPLSKIAAEAYLELGNIALIEGKVDEADSDFSSVIKLRNATDDEKNKANYKLARVNLYKGKVDEARNYLTKVLTNLRDNSANDAVELSLILNPDMSDSSNLLIFAQAEFLAEQKKFDDAAINYKKLSENPMLFMLKSISAVRYGEMMIAVDNYQEAVSILKSVSAEGEKNIYSDKAVYLLGKIHQYGVKNYSKAEEYYQELLADFPKSIYAEDAREQLLLLQNKPGT